jgi:hypothetical protein
LPLPTTAPDKEYVLVGGRESGAAASKVTICPTVAGLGEAEQKAVNGRGGGFRRSCRFTSRLPGWEAPPPLAVKLSVSVPGCASAGGLTLIVVVPVVVGFCVRTGCAHPGGTVQLKVTGVWEKLNPFTGVIVSVAGPLSEGNTLRPGNGLR